MNNLANFNLDTPIAVFSSIVSIIIILCVITIFIAVLIDFIEFKGRKGIKKEKRSIVETGTMTLFFIIFYFVLRLRFGEIMIENAPVKVAITIIGVLSIVFGCIFNIKGRLELGKNWANQIKIYKSHTLITKGVYRIVRHHLYASLIWMFYGACLVYSNYLAFLLNSLIFVPFMYYRAKQEEELLTKQFKNYKNYILKVGMFFPKLRNG